ANEVPLAIQKGVERARKDLFRVPKHGSTITHQTTGIYGSGRVLLKPASPGTGVIAGGGVRAVLELAGIPDILSKSLGTQNPINLVKATVAGLRGLRTPDEVGELRGLSINQVLGLGGATGEDAGGDGSGAAGSTAGQPAAEQPSANRGADAAASGRADSAPEAVALTDEEAAAGAGGSAENQAGWQSGRSHSWARARRRGAGKRARARAQDRSARSRSRADRCRSTCACESCVART